MKLNRYYRHINIIVLLLYMASLNAKEYPPIGNEENINLEISGTERTYYKLDDGLIYENIAAQYEMGDSIQVCIYSRTIMDATGKKNKKYGFTVQINENEPLQLKYKKEVSKAIRKERPGWSYSKAGFWYLFLPFQKSGYKIKIKPLDRKPVVYFRLTSNRILNKGEFTKIIKTVNQQDRIDIATNDIKRKYYILNRARQQQFEIKGPAKVRVFSRIKFDNDRLTDDYYIFVREDGIDLGTYYFQTEKSTESSVIDSKETVSKWRSLWLNIPSGKHYYTFSLPNVKENKYKTAFIRLKKWIKE